MPARVDVLAMLIVGCLMPGVAPAAGKPPHPDLLEFLGLLIEADGAWVDPMDVATAHLPAPSASPELGHGAPPDTEPDDPPEIDHEPVE